MLIRKYLNKGVDYDDLYQVASMALLLAVERFDSSKGFAFTSFATPTIIGEIKRYFRDKGWALKVPRTIQEIALRLPISKDELQFKLHRPPTIPELSLHMGYGEDEILEAMESAQNYRTYSLSRVIEETEEGENGEMDGYAHVNEKGYEQVEDVEIIRNVMRRLTEVERKVFVGRLLNNRTQRDVAKKLRVSQMTVSRMENDIRKKLKEEYMR
ncbi:MAG: sigma-70 family RNA polymerase sigma factor, partial [Clostridiales Family XIII bacterium]|jgi:RNA polymerase sigma-B factor|nr:sigma-70 family RNA polymerase sigma factor [Clostridiales Family XIII bacterium]